MIKKPLVLLLLLFTLTRLVNLTLLPIFADEANYLDWGWRSLHVPGMAYYSLYDAKQPLLIWLFGLSEIIFTDPLFAGRLISVIIGATCLLGIYFTARDLFDRRTAILAGLLYIFVPLFIFYDRQALMETAIASIGIWSFYFFRRLLDHPGFKNTLFLALTLAIGIWIKNTALLFLVAVFIISFIHFLLHRDRIFPLLNHLFTLLTLLAIFLFPLFFQHSFWASFSLNSRYSLDLPELIRFPLALWFRNLSALSGIAFYFLTPFVFLAALYAFFKYRSSHLYFLVWTVVPLLQLIITARSFNLRYPVAFLVPLLILTAAVFPKKTFYLAALYLIPAILSAFLIFSPPRFFDIYSRFTPYSSASEYVTGPLTGYLVNNLVSYINQLDPASPLIVTTALNSGNFEAALIDYFHGSPRILTTYMDSQLLPAQISDYDCLSLSDTPLIFIARQQQQAGLNKFLVPRDVIYPDHGSDFATIYTLKTGCSPEKTAIVTLTRN